METTVEQQELKPRSLMAEVWKLALPMALQSLLFALISLVDNLFIGYLPNNAAEAASALNAIANVSYIVSSIITGFLLGIGIYFTQANSKNDQSKVRELFSIKLYWAIGLSLVFLTIATIFIKPFASLWVSKYSENADGIRVLDMVAYEKTLDLAQAYALWVFPSSFLSYVSFVFATSFKEVKLVKIPVIVGFIVVGVNSALNYPLIYTLGMGVEGSAIATAVARTVEFLFWIIFCFVVKYDFIPNYKDMFKVDFKKMFSIFPKSFWWMLNSVFASMAFTLQIMFISQMSSQAGTSLNTAGAVAQLVGSFAGGYSSAVSVIVIHRIANKTNKEFRDDNKTLSLYSAATGIFLGLLLFGISFGMPLLYPYKGNPQASFINKQSQIMLICIAAKIWMDLLMTIYISALKGGGYAKVLLLLDNATGWFISLPLAIILAYVDTNVSYGWAYLIVILSSYIKVPIVIGFYLKKAKTIKPLVM